MGVCVHSRVLGQIKISICIYIFLKEHVSACVWQAKWLYTDLAPIFPKWWIGVNDKVKILYGVCVHSRVLGQIKISICIYIFLKEHVSACVWQTKWLYTDLAPIFPKWWIGANDKVKIIHGVCVHSRVLGQIKISICICIFLKEHVSACVWQTKWLYTDLAPIFPKCWIGANDKVKITYGVCVHSRVLGQIKISICIYIFRKEHVTACIWQTKCLYTDLAPIFPKCWIGADNKVKITYGVCVHSSVRGQIKISICIYIFPK